MTQDNHNFYSQILHGLLVAAFLLAGISPACKFISGDAFAMEICKSDGTVIIMTMNEDGSLTEEEKRPQHLDTDCSFCFSTQNIKTLATVDLKPSLTLHKGQTGILATSTAIARASANHLYAPRGPPTLVV